MPPKKEDKGGEEEEPSEKQVRRFKCPPLAVGFPGAALRMGAGRPVRAV